MHILKCFLSCNACDTYYVKENPASFSLVYIYHWLKVYESSRFIKQLILWFEDRQMNKGFI